MSGELSVHAFEMNVLFKNSMIIRAVRVVEQFKVQTRLLISQFIISLICYLPFVCYIQILGSSRQTKKISCILDVYTFISYITVFVPNGF